MVGADGTVLSFKRGRRAFEILIRDIQLNHLTNVRAIRAAVGKTQAIARLLHHPDPGRNALCRTAERQGTAKKSMR